ncbi:MAG: hypothetical protein ACT4QG_15795 [Sporichthyaceae bacterium]
MKRLFWTGLGVAVGVMATRKITEAAHAFTPAGATERLAGSIAILGDAVREFGQGMRDAMWEREDELYEALGLNDVPDTEPAKRK